MLLSVQCGSRDQTIRRMMNDPLLRLCEMPKRTLTAAVTIPVDDAAAVTPRFREWKRGWCSNPIPDEEAIEIVSAEAARSV